MATCVTSSLDNQRVDTGPSGTYLLYGYKNACGNPADVFLKISNEWSAGGILSTGEWYVRILYNPGDSVVIPGTIVFCPLGRQPKSDTTCN